MIEFSVSLIIVHGHLWWNWVFWYIRWITCWFSMVQLELFSCLLSLLPVSFSGSLNSFQFHYFNWFKLPQKSINLDFLIWNKIIIIYVSAKQVLTHHHPVHAIHSIQFFFSNTFFSSTERDSRNASKSI